MHPKAISQPKAFLISRDSTAPLEVRAARPRNAGIFPDVTIISDHAQFST
jgi:hypothetical protein